METKIVQPLSRPIHTTIVPPGSKSITNRAFILAALARGETHLTGVLHSDDTQYMSNALKQLGVEIEQDINGSEARIVGCSGQFPAPQADLFLGNSGTSVRFLTAALVHGIGSFRLDGIERMRQRPIADLVEALRRWNVAVDYELNNGFPPIKMTPNGRIGTHTAIKGSVSSQFLSALMMAAVGSKEKSTISVLGDLVSRPYVKMTRSLMEAFGVRLTEREFNSKSPSDCEPSDCESSDCESSNCESSFNDQKSGPLDADRPTLEIIIDGNQEYRGCKYAIEPDASAASYFFAAAAVAGGQVRVEGLSRNAIQGDIRFVDCLERMGCEVEWVPNATIVRRSQPLHGIDVDMHDISDTAQTLGVAALFADSPTTIRNVANMRLKETDRIAALCAELRKFGAHVQEYPDGLTVRPRPVDQYSPATIATYDDHRMAMSFAVAGLKIPGVCIENPGCTSKTFPRFFEELERIGK